MRLINSLLAPSGLSLSDLVMDDISFLFLFFLDGLMDDISIY